jgi:hypothetical protein
MSSPPSLHAQLTPAVSKHLSIAKQCDVPNEQTAAREALMDREWVLYHTIDTAVMDHLLVSNRERLAHAPSLSYVTTCVRVCGQALSKWTPAEIKQYESQMGFALCPRHFEPRVQVPSPPSVKPKTWMQAQTARRTAPVTATSTATAPAAPSKVEQQFSLAPVSTSPLWSE